MIPMPLFIYLGVAMWIGLSDGLKNVEKALIIKRVNELFPHTDAEQYFDELMEDFEDGFHQTTEDIRGAILNYNKIDEHREPLLAFARQCVLDDGELTKQEETAISEIEKILKI